MRYVGVVDNYAHLFFDLILDEVDLLLQLLYILLECSSRFQKVLLLYHLALPQFLNQIVEPLGCILESKLAHLFLVCNYFQLLLDHLNGLAQPLHDSFLLRSFVTGVEVNSL